MSNLIFVLSLTIFVGCAGNQQLAQRSPIKAAARRPAVAAKIASSPATPSERLGPAAISPIEGAVMPESEVRVVAHDVTTPTNQVDTAGDSLVEHPSDSTQKDTTRGVAPNAVYFERNGASHRYREGTFSRQKPAASAEPLTTFDSRVDGIGVAPVPIGGEEIADTEVIVASMAANNFQDENVVDMNLPTVLAMIDGRHPAVGIAQCRVQEAYAQLARAEVLWLPSIQAGFSFQRHDGNYQASDGTIVDVNRNSFQYGLGAGATGAGTTPRPGIVAQFHLADAIFHPAIAEKTAWARGHAANAVVNEQLLAAALAYIELLDSHQDARIVESSRTRTEGLSKITVDFAESGEGLQADADRLQTELALVDNRLVAARERISIASARLTQALSMDAGSQIKPTDVIVVPLEMVSLKMGKTALLCTGLSTRPELKASKAIVAAACEAYRRERNAPFVPSVLLGFSTGGFGGGLGNDLNNVDSRYDFDALMLWEVRNLGFGEAAARQESCARVRQAKFEKLRLMDQVARDVSEAYSQVQHRRKQIAITQQAIKSAENSYHLNLARIRDGKGLPLEVLQSIQALELARRAYLRAVVDHNQAQFRLQWALGWPVTATSDQLANR